MKIPSREYIDLQPGQRLRAVTPLFRSGGYLVPTSEPALLGQTITIQTNGDFLGYEEAFYDVAPGLRIAFATADTVIDGARKPQATPRVPLLPLPSKRPDKCASYTSSVQAPRTTTWPS